MPKPVKTGTTIAGVVFADGIVLGADTRYVGSLRAHRGLALQGFVPREATLVRAWRAADNRSGSTGADQRGPFCVGCRPIAWVSSVRRAGYSCGRRGVPFFFLCFVALLSLCLDRATSGSTVFEKFCEKIHYIAPNIYCCGAGTSADTESSTGLISSQLELHRLATGRESRVSTSLTMLKRMLFRYQGHVSAALVLGGVDLHGPHLYTVYPHGSTDRLPYVTMGSGSLAAMAVFETGYKDDLSLEDAKNLVYRGISAGIYNDLGSGGNVDLCIIKRGSTEYLRGFATENARKYRRPSGYAFAPGTTAVLSSKFTRPLKEIAVVEEAGVAEAAVDGAATPATGEMDTTT